jgi:hypothetical protein
MRWGYDKRVEAVHAWGAISVGVLVSIGVPTVLVALHSTDHHFRWWWPTNWMLVPVAILALGLVMLVVPVLRSGPDHTSEGPGAETPAGKTDERKMPRPGALVVTILDVSWELWRRRVLIVTLRAKLTNTTSKTVRLEATRLVGDEDSGYLDWLSDDKISQADKANLAMECLSKCTLTGNSQVGPYEDRVGVFCAPVSRTNPFGGTPALTFAVHDVIGNQYTARIEEQTPEVFSSPSQQT